MDVHCPTNKQKCVLYLHLLNFFKLNFKYLFLIPKSIKILLTLYRCVMANRNKNPKSIYFSRTYCNSIFFFTSLFLAIIYLAKIEGLCLHQQLFQYYFENPLNSVENPIVLYSKYILITIWTDHRFTKSIKFDLVEIPFTKRYGVLLRSDHILGSSRVPVWITRIGSN